VKRFRPPPHYCHSNDRLAGRSKDRPVQQAKRGRNQGKDRKSRRGALLSGEG